MIGQAFIGREPELAAIGTFLDEVLAGAGLLLVIEGEAGIGKTRMAEVLIDEASTRGLATKRGAGHQLDRTFPLAPVAEALALHPETYDPETVHIGGMLCAETSEFEDSAAAQFRLLGATLEHLERLFLERPIVVVLEDLHWADPLTLTFVERLASRIGILSVGVVVTLRPLPRSPELRRILDTAIRAERPASSCSRSRGMTWPHWSRASWGPSLVPALLQTVAGTGGNPLFIRELVDAWRSEGTIDFIGRPRRFHDVSPPLPSLRMTILRRLSFLSEQTLETIKIASVLGSSFEARALALAIRRPAAHLASLLGDALLSGVLGEREGQLDSCSLHYVCPGERRSSRAVAPIAPLQTPSSLTFYR